MAKLKPCPLCGSNAVRQHPLQIWVKASDTGRPIQIPQPMVTCSSVYAGSDCQNGLISVYDAVWQENTGSLTA